MSDPQALMKAQQDTHELVAHSVPLEETLGTITAWAGRLLPDALISVMRHDPESRTLSMVANSQFSSVFIRRLQDLCIEDGVGTCGTAAFWRRLTITEDILTDARWDLFRDAARVEGVRACWSTPILTEEGLLLGTFATYYRQPATPSPASQAILKQAASLAALAIVRDRDNQEFHRLAVWHHSLFTNHPDGVYKFGLDGRVKRANAALERLTGFTEEALLGCHFTELLGARDHAAARDAFAAALRGESRQYEMLGCDAAGHVHPFEVTTFPVTSAAGIVGMYAICQDISHRKRQEADRALLERGIQATPNGVLMADASRPDMPLVYANAAFHALTGYAPEEVLGLNCRFLQGQATCGDTVSAIRHAVAARQPIETTLLNYRKDGTPFWNHLSLSPLFDGRGICTHYIGIQQDITQQRNQEALIAHQTTHDQLTGLLNRTAFDERLEVAFAQAQQDQTLLVLMHVDLDGFKAINDGLGHHIGNQLLIEIASRLRQWAGDGDTLARMTGDEFVLLLPALQGPQAAIEMAEQLLDALSKPFVIGEEPLHISASIGIACNGEHMEQAFELMQRADLAVTSAKQQGRNTWHWYQGDVQRVTREMVLLRHDLHTALHDDQFELFYQPIVEAVCGRIRGLEALIRWQHPERGLISPGVFIPLAEQTGQIIPLGRWVLRRACRDAATMRREGRGDVPVAVNISSLQFRRSGFLADVQSALDDAGLPPELLELEITESVLLNGADSAIELIEVLKDMGVRVALDDFGTGFSSLSYLRDLPIHKVKLDRAFIHDITTSRSNAAIVQGIITMAHHLGLLVVAEGIEEQAQQQDLDRRQCDLLQGFYFARPMPREAVMQLPDRLPASA
ncbi:EAL domain-containing protein [uncultured Halomonas sp.]|uniref:bifunctional diguanylate cyclase/phosphodiesterase n=1 Tax=uncultured Halomonas sp. TaxID=173971 RepID=UPI00260B21A1|nr:EAL domain-containing protein [uncultured Halomonas sp.]